MSGPFHLFSETISIAPMSSFSSAGDPIIGSKVTTKARLERERSIEIDAAGNQVESLCRAFVGVEVKLSDRVWLPEDTSTLPGRRVLSVAYHRTPQGEYGYWDVRLCAQ